MENTPLHPAIVHLPIGLAMAIPFLALTAYFLIKKEKIADSAWLLVVCLQLLLVIGAVAALQTGEHDEELVEKIISHDLIESHEDLGKVFTAATSATLIVLWAGRVTAYASIMRILGIILSFITLGIGLQTGKLGGELVYREGAANAYIKKSVLQKQAAPATSKPEHKKEEHDDDDDH